MVRTLSGKSATALGCCWGWGVYCTEDVMGGRRKSISLLSPRSDGMIENTGTRGVITPEILVMDVSP